jgi:protein-L-isoaspartate(D-aspartate) O-methyltransferase
MGHMPARALADRSWHQYNITFTSHGDGELVAARHLLPALTAAQASRSLDQWWYIRKRPAWRLRYLAPPGPGIGALLDHLTSQREITGWTRGIYEPETTAFGGPDALPAAHLLFHHDSRHILARVTAPAGIPALGKRETAIVLCSAMLRGAELDWYEQGDVWDKVARLRAGAGALPAGQAAQLRPAMYRLLTISTRNLDGGQTGAHPGSSEWISAFEQTGQALADLARTGALRRGVRSVLAHHVIFHANRAGLPVRDQSILATLAAGTMFSTFPGTAFLPDSRLSHS